MIAARLSFMKFSSNKPLACRSWPARAKGARPFSASAHRQGTRRWSSRQAPWRPLAGADSQQARSARRPHGVHKPPSMFAKCQHRKLDCARYAVVPPVRGFPEGPTALPWAAAILDNTKDKVEPLKVQIGFLPRRPETEAPFCLEDYNNRIAPAQATSRQVCCGRRLDRASCRQDE
jgi:hypothetical protein